MIFFIFKESVFISPDWDLFFPFLYFLLLYYFLQEYAALNIFGNTSVLETILETNLHY